MRAARLGCIALLCLAVPWATAQEPRVRTSLPGGGECWVGQRVTLVVELLAPGYFAGAPSFDLPDPPGMLIVPPRGSPTLSSEELDGTTYTVQRHELAIFAHRAGPQVIPPLSVRFHFKRQPLDKEAVDATVTTQVVTLTAKPPPGAERLSGIISAHQLTAVEEWHPQPGKAKAGDAFTRTIIFAAPDVPGMAFAPFPAGKVDGLGVYPKPPEVVDHEERGTLLGERRETITYVCERPGRFVLPAERFSWFDLAAEKVRVIEFPPRTFDVSPNPAMQAAQQGGDEPARRRGPSAKTMAATSAVLILIAGAAAWLARTWRRWAAPFRPTHLAPLNPVAHER